MVLDLLDPLLLKASEETFGMVDLLTLQQMLLTGSATAFAMTRKGIPEFVLIVTLVNYATYRAARIIACAGKNMKNANKYFSALETWALTQGAVELEGWCRPVMVRHVRKFGWRSRVSLVTRDLRGKLQ